MGIEIFVFIVKYIISNSDCLSKKITVSGSVVRAINSQARSASDLSAYMYNWPTNLDLLLNKLRTRANLFRF